MFAYVTSVKNSKRSCWRARRKAGSLNCVNEPKMPCDDSHGSRWDEFHAAARSYHPGGVNVVFGDGHVSLISETIELQTWRCLGAMNDGEVITAAY